VGLFRRSRTLHRQLADAGGLSVDGDPAPPRTGLATEPPGWDGEQRGEPGIHGVSRTRRWDTVATAEAPGLRGDELRFAALPDGTLLVEGDQPDDALVPLAATVESSLDPPYRAEAVRRSGSVWAVGARRIVVVSEPSLHGNDAELVVNENGRALTVDGEEQLLRAPAFEAAGERLGPEFVVRARRLDGELWEIETTPL